MEKILNIITILEDEMEIQRKLSHRSTNENITNWTRGYLKGLDFSIRMIKCFLIYIKLNN